MFEEVKTAVEIALTVSENRERIKQVSKGFFNHLRRGDFKIVVFGSFGTGKSTLGKQLGGLYNPATVPHNYEISTLVEKHQFKKDSSCKILVAPGQEILADRYWPDLIRVLERAKNRLVINVVANGYHTPGEIDIATSYSQPTNVLSLSQAKGLYFSECLTNEIKQLEYLNPRISDLTGNLTFITLVSKQDLWWNDRISIQNHYENGDYNRIIEEIKVRRGQQNFTHHYMSASLFINNLRTNQGDLLIPVSEGYDQNIQYLHLNRLFETITKHISE